jgi:hypothetical protein
MAKKQVESKAKARGTAINKEDKNNIETVEPKRGQGRPTKYKPEYNELAYNYCLLGATDKDLANFFDVCEASINQWKEHFPIFLESIKGGKVQADANVAKSLYNRAIGYSHDAVKIFADAKTGAELIVPYVERFAPDTGACAFWLKNRQPQLWRDRQEVDASHTGKLDVVSLPVKTDNV